MSFIDLRRPSWDESSQKVNTNQENIYTIVSQPFVTRLKQNEMIATNDIFD